MAQFDGKSVLIVDDFPTARRLIKETFQEIGFECIEAPNVDQAIQLLRENKVDLVLADAFMPEKNGLQLLSEIRDDTELSSMDVVLTMMEDHESIITEGEEKGMNGYIVKPFDVFSLSKVLDKVINKAE